MAALRASLIMLLTLLSAACSSNPPPQAGTMDSLSLPAEVIVIGDFGSGSDAQYEVAEKVREKVAEEDVEIFLTTGDNFYNDDIDRIWNEPYGWLREEDIRIAATWGNHDRESEARRMLVNETLHPPGDYYSMDLGGGKLIVLDSNSITDTDQTEWLAAELEDAGSPAIVVFHHPPYTCGVYGTEDVVNDVWLPMIEEYEVPLVLNGHEHHYERFEVKGTTYVVTGGGGQSLRSGKGCPSDTPEPIASNYTDHHFVMMRLEKDVIAFEVITAAGSTIDTFEIEH